MELELTSDQEFFPETTRKFLDDQAPVAVLRAARDDPAGFDRDYWRQGAELGWTSLLVSEDARRRQHLGPASSTSPWSPTSSAATPRPGPLVPTNVVAGALVARRYRRPAVGPAGGHRRAAT